MKKAFVVLCAGFLTAVCFAAENKELANNKSFEQIGKNNVPVGWVVNTVFKTGDLMGSMEVKSSEASDGENYLEITTEGKKSFHLYSALTCDAVPGEKLLISADVKGKGNFQLGVYCYNAENSWVVNVYSAKIKIDSEKWEKKEITLQIPDTDFPNKGKVSKFKLAIVVDGDSKICFDNMSARIDQVVNDPGKTADKAVPDTAADKK